MPFAPHHGFRIHYELFGRADAGRTLVLVFGFGMSALEWAELGYIARLERDFRIVAISPRGHGESSAPPSAEAYRLASLAGDVAAVFDHLGIARAIVWGYSLGAKIVLAMAKAFPEKIQALVLGGFELHAEVDLTRDIVTDTLHRGSDAWRELWCGLLPVPPGMAQRLTNADLRALLSLREAEASWETLEGVPEALQVPCLLYAAEHCFGRAIVQKASMDILACDYIELPGKSHFQAMAESMWICDHVGQWFGRQNS